MFDDLLTRMREIILDCVEVQDDRIVFDISRAEEKGHNHIDVVIAENTLLNDIHFTNKFDDDVKTYFECSEVNLEREFKPIVLYVPFVKIIYVINTKENISASVYEEVLVKGSALKQTFNRLIDTSFTQDDFTKKKIEFKW